MTDRPTPAAINAAAIGGRLTSILRKEEHLTVNDTATRTLDDLPPLAKGAHAPDSGQACMMEAAAYIAGEPWSDYPACVCPVIAAFARRLNDAMPDDMRDALLRPLVPLVIGTRARAAVERRRAYIAADFAARQAAPAALRAAELHVDADKLAYLPAITSAKTARAAADAAAAYTAYTAAYTAADAAAAAAAYTAYTAAYTAYTAAAADAAAAAAAADIWAKAADCIRRMCEET
jgi:hypothetical protein